MTAPALPAPAECARFAAVARDLAARAGAIALAALQQPVAFEYKGERRRELVTATDRQIEAFLRDELQARFPEHGVLGEEGADLRPGADLRWVLDPLDGTVNFANRLPIFGVSLGLLCRGVPIAGAIFVPVGLDLQPGVFHAARGCGAFYGDQPIRAATGLLERSRLGTLPGHYHRLFRLRGEFARRPGDVRTLGSATAEQALVAAGVLQYAVMVRPRAWDVAAGALLVQEAGGAALTFERGLWRDLYRLVPPERGRGGRPPSLRDWGQPVVLGGAVIAGAVAAGLRWWPRLPPCLRPLLRWL